MVSSVFHISVLPDHPGLLEPFDPGVGSRSGEIDTTSDFGVADPAIGLQQSQDRFVYLIDFRLY